MTAYPIEEPVVHAGSPPPRPPVFTDVLPAAPGEKPAAVRWTPGRKVGTGLLCIQTPAGRCSCTYAVTEHRTDWDGRAARFEKLDPGSDPEADSYDVFVPRRGTAHRCDCRGFERWGRCKHAAALSALVWNGWLDLSPVNPDADVGPTDPPDDQEEPAGFGLTAEEEDARCEVRRTVRGLAGWPVATDPAAALAWLESPAAARLLAVIGWDGTPPATLFTILTGHAA